MAHQNSMIIWERTITSPAGTQYSTYYTHADKALQGVDDFRWCDSNQSKGIGHGKYLGDIAWVRKETLWTDTGE